MISAPLARGGGRGSGCEEKMPLRTAHRAPVLYWEVYVDVYPIDVRKLPRLWSRDCHEHWNLFHVTLFIDAVYRECAGQRSVNPSVLLHTELPSHIFFFLSFEWLSQ